MSLKFKWRYFLVGFGIHTAFTCFWTTVCPIYQWRNACFTETVSNAGQSRALGSRAMRSGVKRDAISRRSEPFQPGRQRPSGGGGFPGRDRNPERCISARSRAGAWVTLLPLFPGLAVLRAPSSSSSINRLRSGWLGRSTSLPSPPAPLGLSATPPCLALPPSAAAHLPASAAAPRQPRPLSASPSPTTSASLGAWAPLPPWSHRRRRRRRRQ